MWVRGGGCSPTARRARGGAGERGGAAGGLSTPPPLPAPAAPPRAMEPGTPPAPRCALEPRPPYEPVPAALCALGALFGVVCGCFGYRCFKAIMFLSGLLFGSIVIFLLCYKERVLETQLSLEASAGIALGIGLLCGLVTMLLRSVGLFTTGLLLGLLLATAALVAAAPVLPPPSPWVPAGSLLGLALLCALLALQWPKALTVLSTAVFGAAVVVVCADYFVEALALVLYVYDRLRLAPAGPLCWHSWVLLGAWPALSLLAVLLQWKLTADGVSHTDGERGCTEGYPPHTLSRPARGEGVCRAAGAPGVGAGSGDGVLGEREERGMRRARMRRGWRWGRPREQGWRRPRRRRCRRRWGRRRHRGWGRGAELSPRSPQSSSAGGRSGCSCCASGRRRPSAGRAWPPPRAPTAASHPPSSATRATCWPR
uniref:Transmembrane protein 198 n=1 Tax=Accipiter nisus TaxID=211598 RepID=A0A8B9NL95_9AVES